MSESHQYQDGASILILNRGDLECVALEARYAGLQFNRVKMHFLPPDVLRDDPEREACDTYFNLSGSASEIVRQGFEVSDWWPHTSVMRTSRNCDTPGFGHVWLVARTRNGFRLQGARYDDAMTKLCRASLPYSWQPRSNVR